MVPVINNTIRGSNMKFTQISIAAAGALVASSAFAAGSAVGELPDYPAAVNNGAPAYVVVDNRPATQAFGSVALGEIPNYPGATQGGIPVTTDTALARRNIPDSVIGAIPNYPGDFPSSVNDTAFADNVGTRG